MPAPLAKGLIIAASVLVAAGLALYESPQVRQWVDQSRRKIAIALHNLGDEINPRQSESSSMSRGGDRDLDDERRRRQEEVIRRDRAELIRKAREEGVAVDLDELARLGTELRDLQHHPRPRKNTADANRSFDDLVGADGMLKPAEEKQQASTALASGNSHSSQDQLRFRGRMDGAHEGSHSANPFADDHAQAVLDRHLVGPDTDDMASHTVSAAQNNVSRETTATLAGEQAPNFTALSQHLIDLSANSPRIEGMQTASIHSLPSEGSPFEDAEAVSAEQALSFYSLHSTPSTTPARSRSHTLQLFTPGAATPTDDGFSTSASVIGSHADDIAQLHESLHSLQDRDDDAMSEAFSEIGAGQSTPGSWTDVGSDDGSEMGMH